MTEREIVEAYREHGACVFRYCTFRTGSRHDAEEVTADVFLALLEHGDRLRGRPLLPWLLRVAHNKCANTVRGRSREVPMDQLPEGDPPAGGLDSWTDPSVWHALSRMRPLEQRVIFLRVVEDRTFEEVASTMGRRQSATKMLYYRAIRRLGDLLDEGDRHA